MNRYIAILTEGRYGESANYMTLEQPAPDIRSIYHSSLLWLRSGLDGFTDAAIYRVENGVMIIVAHIVRYDVSGFEVTRYSRSGCKTTITI